MPCATCSFDAAAWTDQDLQRTLDELPTWWRQLADGAPEDLLRPYAEVIDALPRLVVDADAVHRGWHAIATAGRLKHVSGFGAATHTGRVEQVSASNGGVPKLPLAHGRITRAGLDGDRQATRKHHGRPFQALCLWSAEQVDALAAEGHPIGYGSAGENLTLRGLTWSGVRSGTQLRVGTALVEITADAIPCRKNGRWFADGRFSRLKVNSRRYARVLEEGDVAPGDLVVVEPLDIPLQRPAAAVVAAG
jgi:MOSC domain-containing protein YiiM